VTEGLRLGRWPVVSLSAPLTPDTLTAFNYYAFWTIPLAGLAVLAAGPWIDTDDRPGARRGIGIALVMMAVLANYFFLRNNLPARFPDAVVPVVLLAAWIAGAAATTRSRTMRVVIAAAPPVLLALMLVAFVRVNSIVQELHSGGITESITAARLKFDNVAHTLRSLPPDDWTAQDTAGPMAASRYLAECTSPDDYVLVGTYAYEIPYFARRRFAGGQGLFSHGYFRDQAFQRLVLERLARQSVPIVFTDVDYQVFVDDYPIVAQHVSDRYQDFGIIQNHGAPYVRVFVEKGRTPVRTDPNLGLPCFR
jgi:hypothetical protein